MWVGWVFATKAFTTVKDLSEDVVPLVNAADEELARQWCGELPLQLPVPHSHITLPLPSRKGKSLRLLRRIDNKASALRFWKLAVYFQEEL